MSLDIDTPRLRLVETYRVVDDHVKWLNDKTLMRFSEQQFREHDYCTQKEYLDAALVAGTPLVYDIRLKGTIGEAYGVAGLGPTIGSFHVHIAANHSLADLGIMLGPEYHGKGYGLEAWENVEHFLFYKMNMVKLEAGCVDDNLAMRSILVRSGWTLEGVRTSHFMYDGHRRGLCFYGQMRGRPRP